MEERKSPQHCFLDSTASYALAQSFPHLSRKRSLPLFVRASSERDRFRERSPRLREMSSVFGAGGLITIGIAEEDRPRPFVRAGSRQ